MDKAMNDQRSEAVDQIYTLLRTFSEKDLEDGEKYEDLLITEREAYITLQQENATIKAELGATRTALGIDKEAMKQEMFKMECEVATLKARVEELENDLGECAELVKSLWTPCPEGICSSCEEMKVKLAIWQQKKKD